MQAINSISTTEGAKCKENHVACPSNRSEDRSTTIISLPVVYSLRPMFPNATALTKRTLAIHVATPTLSSVNVPSTKSCPLMAFAVALATLEKVWRFAA